MSFFFVPPLIPILSLNGLRMVKIAILLRRSIITRGCNRLFVMAEFEFQHAVRETLGWGGVCFNTGRSSEFFFSAISGIEINSKGLEAVTRFGFQTCDQ